MRLSRRALALAESETLRLSAKVAALRRSGRPVLSLLEGEPELPAPRAAVGATVQALRRGRTRYCEAAGLPELKAALARKLRERNGVAASEENILVANGAKQALYDALQAICGPGDEVIVPRPYWVTFPESVRLAGARPVFVDAAERDHQLDPARVAAALSPRTKAILINSPNNPTGAVYPRETMRELARLAERRGVWLVSDEAYEDLAYGSVEHVSPARFGPGVLSVFTFSKSYAMAGYRVGYLVGPRELVRAAGRIHGHVSGNVCTFAQLGALGALRSAAAAPGSVRAAMERRRDLAYALASALFPCALPHGSLFIFADVRRFLRGGLRDSAAFAERLLRASGVAVVPGSACGREGFIRISFSAREGALRAAFARIGEALRP